MGRTIIQPIGPLYGEAVNGTVFGRPNGSVYIPSTNEITLSLSDTGRYVCNVTSGGIKFAVLCDSNGTRPATTRCSVVAKSQDSQSYIQMQFSESSDFSSFSYENAAAGVFNLSPFSVSRGSSTPTVVSETTYYLRAQLIASSGVAVATSDVFEVTGWVAE